VIGCLKKGLDKKANFLTQSAWIFELEDLERCSPQGPPTQAQAWLTSKRLRADKKGDAGKREAHLFV
jgi:hypothetical protein